MKSLGTNVDPTAPRQRVSHKEYLLLIQKARLIINRSIKIIALKANERVNVNTGSVSFNILQIAHDQNMTDLHESHDFQYFMKVGYPLSRAGKAAVDINIYESNEFNELNLENHMVAFFDVKGLYQVREISMTGPVLWSRERFQRIQ